MGPRCHNGFARSLIYCILIFPFARLFFSFHRKAFKIIFKNTLKSISSQQYSIKVKGLWLFLWDRVTCFWWNISFIIHTRDISLFLAEVLHTSVGLMKYPQPKTLPVISVESIAHLLCYLQDKAVIDVTVSNT